MKHSRCTCLSSAWIGVLRRTLLPQGRVQHKCTHRRLCTTPEVIDILPQCCLRQPLYKPKSNAGHQLQSKLKGARRILQQHLALCNGAVKVAQAIFQNKQLTSLNTNFDRSSCSLLALNTHGEKLLFSHGAVYSASSHAKTSPQTCGESSVQ